MVRAHRVALLPLGLLVAFSLTFLLLASCVQPNKQLWYGTWTSEKGPYQKSVHAPDGMVQDFSLLSDTTPVQRLKMQIVRCWSDSEGNTWFNNEGTVLEGPHKNSIPKFQTLEKISKSGSVLEVMARGVVEFNPKNFPTKIDPTDPYFYLSFTRLQK